MKEFYAEKFMILCQGIMACRLELGKSYNSIEPTTTFLEERKPKNFFDKLFLPRSVIDVDEKHNEAIKNLNETVSKGNQIASENRQALYSLLDVTLEGMEKTCQDMELDLSSKAIQKARMDISKITPDYIQTISDRIFDELENTHLFQIFDKQITYYELGDLSFGQEVLDQFPSAAFEIDEAAKTFALNRSTASVFHLMRAMEIGLRSIAKCLQIYNPTNPNQKNWGNILGSIKKEIDSKKISKTWNNADQSFFNEVYTSVDAVKTSWRNSTMHVERVYTEEEAENIFISVKSLMKKLSERMNEDGQPYA